MSVFAFRFRFILLGITTAMSWSCSEDDSIARRFCNSDSDCRTGLVCRSGSCERPVEIDTDGDGVPDRVEIEFGTDVESPDTDGDGRTDREELEQDDVTRGWSATDSDGDGIPDALEPNNQDSDEDGVPDGEDPCNDDPDCPVEGGTLDPCEMLAGEPCAVGVGACAAVGETVCTADRQDVFCNGEALPESAEACDEIDNDCDGATDEDFPELGQACVAGDGVCQAEGVWRCGEDGGIECGAELRTASEELCDGVDNDCDGQVDEAFPDLGEDCMAVAEECAVPGIVACNPESGTSECIPPQVPEFAEQCDGIDNDCDGSTDEDFAGLGEECVSGQGACASTGVLRCHPEMDATVCEAPAVAPTEETCNEIDDDCDGDTDEGFNGLGTPCSIGNGACRNEGTLVCGADALSTVCSAQAIDASVERCDGEDNDCDGEVDENFDIGTPCSTGLGLCRAEGVRTCDPLTGRLRCDAIAGAARAEQCDGQDNDCDGSTDEDFPDLGDRCELGVGDCRAEGVRQCSAAGDATLCDANPDPLVAELCDGADNDCDGEIDENLDLGAPCEVGVGRCLRAGQLACADDGSVVCDAVAPEGDPEICDGIDNDCDLITDEGFEQIGALCLVGQGECAASGTRVCAADGLTVVCDTVAGEPEEEQCDGRDNDCDGNFDEDFRDIGDLSIGARCAVGEGACARNGRRVCSPDGSETICPATPADPRAETCNQFDDDCDGAVDEDFGGVGDPCDVGVGACQRAGVVACNDAADGTRCTAEAGEPSPERCDALDNDCDASADEDFNDRCEFRALDVSVADYESCSVTTSNEIRCWGDSEADAPAGRFDRIVSGNNFHCGVDGESRLDCWGDRNGGRLDAPEAAVSDAALGLDGHGCAVEQAGNTLCWGRDAAGETDPPDAALLSVSAGLEFSCGLSSADRSPVCWGRADFNVLNAPPFAFQMIDSGVSATCGVLLADNSLECWGEDIAGQLDAPDGEFTSVSVGGYFACAITSESALRCWGSGNAGQLVVPEGMYQKVSVGASHACALSTEGVVRCWGAGEQEDNPGFPNLGQSAPPR